MRTICPKCKKTQEIAQCACGKCRPKAGMVCVCASCRTICIFTDELTLRLATVADISAFSEEKAQEIFDIVQDLTVAHIMLN